MYYHVAVYTKSESQRLRPTYNLDRTTLEDQIIRPYREHRELTLRGERVRWQYIELIKIVETLEDSGAWLIKQQAEKKAEARHGGPRPTIIPLQRIFQEAHDVTTAFLPELQPSRDTMLVSPTPKPPGLDSTYNNPVEAIQRHQLIDTLAQVFPTRPKIDTLVGEALHLRLPPTLVNPFTIFEHIITYCEAHGGEYLAWLLNRAVEFEPQRHELKRLRALLVDNGSIPSIKNVGPPQQTPPERIDETIPGGRYIVDGMYVNANGVPIEPPLRYQLISVERSDEPSIGASQEQRHASHKDFIKEAVPISPTHSQGIGQSLLGGTIASLVGVLVNLGSCGLRGEGPDHHAQQLRDRVF